MTRGLRGVQLTLNLLIVTVGLAAAVYAQQCVTRSLRLSRPRSLALLIVLVGVGVVPAILCFYAGLWTPLTWTVASVGVVGVSMSAAALLAIALTRRVADQGIRVWRWASARRAARSESASPPEGRRQVLKQIGTVAAVGASFGAAGYGALFGIREYETEHVSVPIPGLSSRLDGYRIVQLSDLHFGAFVGEREARIAVDLVRRASPDLVVLTGDLVDWEARHVPLVGKLVHRLTLLGARDGVVAVSGNHDYYVGADQVLAATRRAGATVLRNDALPVAEGRLALLGVDWGEDANLGRAISRATPGLPRVLLCHDPRTFDRAGKHVALQLSGHTHGGQISPLGVNPTALVYRYCRGLYEEGEAHLYVNRGFGVAGPALRVGSPPEVTVVHLRSA